MDSSSRPGGAGSAPPGLLLLGLDHRSVPLALRERVAYSQEEAEKMLVHLLARAEVAEAMLLSTCNRTEVLLQPRDEEEAYRAALELVFLAREPELERPGMLYVKRHGDAARHLLAVASGLESMVLGEPEILGQVRQAAALAEAVGAAGPVLRRLARGALTAGRRARQETAIAAGAVSFGYAAVELARNIFRDLGDCRVLLIGAGEIARGVARSLAERGVGEMRVANRSPERARQFLEEFPRAVAVPFEQRLEALAAVDLVVASTGADAPVITRRQLAETRVARRERPLLVVDLGVPRNVEPAAGRIENVFLHTLDSLDHLVQRNLKRRKEEVPRVEEILDQEVALLNGWFRGMQAEPLIAQLQKQAERIRRQELAQALPHFPAECHPHLDRLTRSLVRKILHHPSNRLRGRDGALHLPRLELVRELFRLDETGDGGEEEAVAAVEVVEVEVDVKVQAEAEAAGGAVPEAAEAGSGAAAPSAVTPGVAESARGVPAPAAEAPLQREPPQDGGRTAAGGAGAAGEVPGKPAAASPSPPGLPRTPRTPRPREEA